MTKAGDQNGDSYRPRIPIALQAVFMASNCGANVDKPPPEQAAYKVFLRNWFHQKKSNSQKSSCESSNTKDNQEIGNSENFQLKEVSWPFLDAARITRLITYPSLLRYSYIEAFLVFFSRCYISASSS